jgi:AraC-like DNA-binding protein
MIVIASNKFKLVQTTLNQNTVIFMNMVIVSIAMICILIFIYFYNEILKIKNKPKPEQKTYNQTTYFNPKLQEIYNNVIAYFEKTHPYRKPNYRIFMLANDLNTNTKCLSDAIRMYYGGSFENLLNKYRLEFAKKMLEEQLAKKYTIEYIYTTAGYSSRSTFYDNFQKTFKMSPLEYMEQNSVSN